MTDTRTRNRALVHCLLLPTIFLTVALLGGLRVSAGTGALVFVAPPLVTLILASMLLVLFARARTIDFGRWLSNENPLLANISHALTLAALFSASAQSFNSVLPEAGLLRWMFSFFFLWTLLNNLFSSFDARRLLHSLAALFGLAFLLKHMFLSSLYAPGGGWLRRLAGAVLEGISLGTLDTEAFAPATGYISFFTLALYVCGLVLLPPAPGADAGAEDAARAGEVLSAYHRLSPAERAEARAEILDERRILHEGASSESKQSERYVDAVLEASEGEQKTSSQPRSK
ncbi:MAG: hypothetical protein LC802_14625 [Acidobacteria bacterium]|nr:hypothetical protein [Acidobacteriota bacterium]